MTTVAAAEVSAEDMFTADLAGLKGHMTRLGAASVSTSLRLEGCAELIATWTGDEAVYREACQLLGAAGPVGGTSAKATRRLAGRRLSEGTVLMHLIHLDTP